MSGIVLIGVEREGGTVGDEETDLHARPRQRRLGQHPHGQLLSGPGHQGLGGPAGTDHARREDQIQRGQRLGLQHLLPLRQAGHPLLVELGRHELLDPEGVAGQDGQRQALDPRRTALQGRGRVRLPPGEQVAGHPLCPAAQ